MRGAQANRSIDGRGRDRRLIGDRSPDDGACNEGGRGEPPPIVLPITATVLPIASMTVVVSPATTPLEARMLDPALMTRTFDAAMLDPVPIGIPTKLHMLQADACRIGLGER
jgi:hypothetical protein